MRRGNYGSEDRLVPGCSAAAEVDGRGERTVEDESVDELSGALFVSVRGWQRFEVGGCVALKGMLGTTGRTAFPAHRLDDGAGGVYGRCTSTQLRLNLNCAERSCRSTAQITIGRRALPVASIPPLSPASETRLSRPSGDTEAVDKRAWMDPIACRTAANPHEAPLYNGTSSEVRR